MYVLMQYPCTMEDEGQHHLYGVYTSASGCLAALDQLIEKSRGYWNYGDFCWGKLTSCYDASSDSTTLERED